MNSVWKWEVEGKDIETRYRNLVDRFRNFGKGTLWYYLKMRNGIAFIENSIYVQNFKTSVGITKTIGLVEALLGFHDVPYFPVDNKSWKKDILSNGNASKDEIMHFAKTRWGEEHITEQDYADASCIALYGVKRFGKG